MRYVRPHFICCALPLADETHGRLQVGFTVSKKCGNAVLRNRTRRRLREAVKAALATHTPTAALEVVVIARPSATEAAFNTLSADMARALSWVEHQWSKRAHAEQAPHEASHG